MIDKIDTKILDDSRDRLRDVSSLLEKLSREELSVCKSRSEPGEFSSSSDRLVRVHFSADMLRRRLKEFLIVSSCAYVESTLKHVVAYCFSLYCDVGNLPGKLSRSIEKGLNTSTGANPRYGKVCEALGYFTDSSREQSKSNEECLKAFKKSMEANWKPENEWLADRQNSDSSLKDLLDKLVNSRNRVAHGESCTDGEADALLYAEVAISISEYLLEYKSHRKLELEARRSTQ
ncbi:HEPN domain-containing protein [Corynebacterium sp. ES2730-CONJ]|uniref:HEPN domain-containing protein n=1 Tax=Corynebacterium sp. ES2730-CONJ TaxID=2973941 RepID=UPI00216AE386|nr:HEPN domain-containing protein [Corynebacterium sp. ES2730-CONJ]MCS4531534.1 HEPN domain-containing protein [Corynebacterium sp. ES2730-CONJ]